MSRDRTLLIAEDDGYLRRVLARALAARSYRVLEAEDVAAARQHLAAGERPQLAVLDLKLPDGSGLDLLAELSRGRERVRLVG